MAKSFVGEPIGRAQPSEASASEPNRSGKTSVATASATLRIGFGTPLRDSAAQRCASETQYSCLEANIR